MEIAPRRIGIRHAEPADFEALRDLLAQPDAQAGTLQLPYPSLELWKKRLADQRDSDKMLVAEVDGQVCGQVGLRIAHQSARRKHAYALGLAVHDAFHGQGVGSALLAAALDLADNWMQIKRLELTVFADNAAAIKLYEKFGFEVEGRHRQYAFRLGAYADCLSMARVRE